VIEPMPDDVTLAPAAAPRVSFEELYRSSYTRMVVVARLTVGDLARAEELVQDAFAQLYRRWGEVSQPHGYLRIAVMNACRSHERRRVVEQRHPVPPAPPTVHDPVAVAVRDALAALTPRQRAAVVLRYYEDLPERDIAAALGCRPGTVKSLLARGLRTLKEHLDD